ncbi:G-D-S-L family lipolytic protein [Tamlana fucoidanivorans]|uniref:G-D-S-L family lipolytic protein n=2 Tax=Allotamlana fucoidanivorans TaxID=2583814 RepID=A0A5C4SP62_9FLAO|nr:G-D-S-L family lipolytic protein [Tamlana fucoidanivorans]TNJ45440.1 G-D-S-L family lipolytic protein [Tamlana fucoidanivorans]
MNTKYIIVLFLLLGFTACNSPEDVLRDNNIPVPKEIILPDLTSGVADFSKYVSVGNSLTAGLSDGTLFLAAQKNAFPKILSEKFELAGGGAFTQPLVSDNFGGLALNGTRIEGFNPRFVTTGGAPQPLESVIGPVTVTTDIVLNNPTGPFNNMGVPGAKSFHVIAPGYGNLANLPLANPYFIRMTGNTPNASILELTMAQNPTFFTLWLGSNDILGYALTGGDGTNPITDQPTFDFAMTTIVNTLTSGGAKGVIANIPYVSDIPNFTTIPWDLLDPTDPDFESILPLIPTLNAQLYGPLNQIFTALGEPDRVNLLSADGPNPLLIHDETATDRSAEIAATLTPVLGAPTAGAFGAIFGKCRQAKPDDLILLAAGSQIGKPAPGLPAPVNVNGISYPLQDQLVLIPSEQAEIKTAVDNFNATIEAAAGQAGLAFVDANTLLSQLKDTGIASNNFILTSDLVTGGAFSLDGVHLTSRGYAIIANEFMKAIDAKYGSNFEASGNLVDIGAYPTNYSPLLQ